jgi:pimeloyl-ACP methyl ester carboxylesterase
MVSLKALRKAQQLPALAIVLTLSAADCAKKQPTSAQSPLVSGFVVKRDGGASKLLVMVHGITGDGRESWTTPLGVYWPHLIEKDAALNDFDVYAYDYHTARFRDCMPVSDIANDLRLRLRDANAFRRYERIVFLAHSMGGLVVRQFLLRNRDLAAMVPLVLFYSTPTAGAEKANLGARIATCRQVDDLRTLDRNSYLVGQQSDWFSSGLAKTVSSVCAIEVKSPTVDRASASMLCSEDPTPINADHSGIVKPASDQDAPHVLLRNTIERAFGQTLAPSVRNAVARETRAPRASGKDAERLFKQLKDGIDLRAEFIRTDGDAIVQRTMAQWGNITTVNVIRSVLGPVERSRFERLAAGKDTPIDGATSQQLSAWRPEAVGRLRLLDVQLDYLRILIERLESVQ